MPAHNRKLGIFSAEVGKKEKNGKQLGTILFDVD